MNKIMVVDNDTMMLEFLSDLLENKGHEVKTAKDGLTALERLETYIPDIMFIDLVMPNISGEKLCRAIRGNPKCKDIYIIIVSAIAAEHAINVSEGILELNINKKIIYANNFVHELTGLSEKELLGLYFHELFEYPHKMR